MSAVEVFLCVLSNQPGMHVNGGPGMIQPPNIGVGPGPMPGPGPGPGPVQGAVGPPGNRPARCSHLNCCLFLLRSENTQITSFYRNIFVVREILQKSCSNKNMIKSVDVANPNLLTPHIC